MINEFQIRLEIEKRNAFRKDADLHVLSAEDEIAKTKQAALDAEFDVFFLKYQDHFEHLWVDSDRGQFEDMRIYNEFRVSLREEFDAMQGLDNS